MLTLIGFLVFVSWPQVHCVLPGTRVLKSCPAGRYGDRLMESRDQCSGPCDPGYWCAAASQSSRLFRCTGSSYCPLGSSGPIPAHLGHWVLQSNDGLQSSELPCDPGYFCVGGQHLACTPGTYSSINLTSSCLACPLGTAQPEYNTTTCLSCAPGTFAGASGLSACFTCSPGTAQPLAGQHDCPLCPANTFAPAATPAAPAIRCQSCRFGSRAQQAGSSACEPCAPGTYPVLESSTTTVMNITGMNLTVVIAAFPTGSFGPVSADGNTVPVTLSTYTCDLCPNSVGVSCLSGQAVAVNNYWISVDPYSHRLQDIVACQPGYCDGSSATSSASSSTPSPVTSNQCAYGRIPDFNTNPLCGACLPGRTEWGGSCIECSQTNVSGVVAAAFISWLYVLVLLGLEMGGGADNGSGDVKILMYYVQTALFMLGPVTSWLAPFGFLNFDANTGSGSGTTSAQCLAPLTPLQKMTLNVLIPIWCGLLLVFTYGLHWLLHRILRILRLDKPVLENTAVALVPAAAAGPSFGSATDVVTVPTPAAATSGQLASVSVARDRSVSNLASVELELPTVATPPPASAAVSINQRFVWSSAYVRCGLTLFLFSYTAITNATFSYLNCVHVGGAYVMVSSPSISCEDSEYKLGLVLMVVLLIVDVLGAPLAMLMFLYRANATNRWVESTFVANYGVLFKTYIEVHFGDTDNDDSKKQKQVEPRTRAATGLGVYWWEVASITRRTILVGISVLLYSSRDDLHTAYGFLSLLFLAAQLYVRPYLRPCDNDFETLCLALLAAHAQFLSAYSPPPPFPQRVEALVLLLLLVPMIWFVVLRVVGSVTMVRQLVARHFPTLDLATYLKLSPDVLDADRKNPDGSGKTSSGQRSSVTGSLQSPPLSSTVLSNDESQKQNQSVSPGGTGSGSNGTSISEIEMVASNS